MTHKSTHGIKNFYSCFLHKICLNKSLANPHMSMTDTPKTPHRWRRITAWIMGSTITLLLLTLMGVVWWLCGWQWGTPTYHESWSEEERSALMEFDTYLCEQFINDISLEAAIAEHELKTWPREMAKAYIAEIHVASIREQLLEITASGRANIPGCRTALGNGVTPAIFASMVGHLQALKALIAHGADPNACVCHADDDDATEGDTPMSCLLRGFFIRSDKRIPWEKRRELAEFLLAHGADLHAQNHIIGLSCMLAHMRGDDAPWFWVISKGKNISGTDLIHILTLGKLNLPLIEKMLQSTPGVANDSNNDQTPLQALALKICYAEEEELPALEQALDLLLAHGASPTLRPEPRDEYDFPERRLPLDILLEKQNFATCGMDGEGCEGDDEARTIWQRMCDKLQQ